MDIQENINVNVNENNNEAKKKIIIFLIIVTIAAIAYLLYYQLVGKYNESTENAYVNAEQITVTSQVGGLVTELNITDTQDVKEGDLLASVDDTDYKIALETAEANIAQAVKAYYSTQSQKNAIDQDINAKKVILEKLAEDYTRNKTAKTAGLITDEQLKASKAAYEQAEAGLKASQSNLEGTKVQLSGSLEEYPPLKQAIAMYKTAYINLSRTKIYAPVSGKVARKNITIGQKLMPNQAILVIVDLNNIWVDANLKETQMKDIKIGDKVELKSDINGKEYEGKIIGISAGSGSTMSLLPAQNASGNWIKVVQRIPVKIAISKKSIEKNGVLPIGSSMEIDVKLKKSSEQNNDDSNFELLKSRATKMYQVDEDKLNAEIQEIINKNK